jgi:flavin-dependent thymidylate synthase
LIGNVEMHHKQCDDPNPHESHTFEDKIGPSFPFFNYHCYGVEVDILRCPTCTSPEPRLHPAVSGGGEVTRICQDPFHSPGLDKTQPPIDPNPASHPHALDVADAECPVCFPSRIHQQHVRDNERRFDCADCEDEPMEDPRPDPDHPKRKSHNHPWIGFPVTDCPACDLPKAPSTEVQRWADEAMFKAEEIDASEGPKVYLLWMTPDPLGAIAAACKMYKGEVVRDLSTVTDTERLEYFEQVQKTKLKAPFEFVKFHFLIEGVTRAFTHQMVRQRTAAYAQESLRFAVKEDMPVGLPPSLAGTTDPGDPSFPDIPSSNESRMRQIWDETIDCVQSRYDKLIDLGMPAEDARGLLPHNVLTRLHYTTDLRALLDHAGNRLCTQAQFEWRLVFAKIIEAIRATDATDYANVLQCNGINRVYMADKLLSAFKPVCFQTGKCEFKANFDRHCNIRDRVNMFESQGVPSSEWEDIERWRTAGIKPGEWLLDPGAARKR